jgi:hypothetical protein
VFRKPLVGRSKIIYSIFTPKCKVTPVLVKSTGACAKLENNSKGLCEETRTSMCIPGYLLFMWGVVLSFPFAISVAATQNPILAL